MDKAYVDFEALFRINSAGAFFVTRAKDTMRYQVVEQDFNIDESTGLRANKIVCLTVAKSKKLYPEKLRLVEFYNDINGELLVFLTNNFDVSALEVANLYRNRWQTVGEQFDKLTDHLSNHRSFFQVDKTKSNYQKTLGTLCQCSQSSLVGGYLCLFDCGIHKTLDAKSTLNL
jgi:hypothetical protein